MGTKGTPDLTRPPPWLEPPPPQEPPLFQQLLRPPRLLLLPSFYQKAFQGLRVQEEAVAQTAKMVPRVTRDLLGQLGPRVAKDVRGRQGPLDPLTRG